MGLEYSMADVEALAQQYKNWGKWGPDDQLGTLNYITPDLVRSAATLVRDGRILSLAIPLAAGVLFSWDIILSPAMGAVLMSLSTVIVAVNARLLKIGK